VSSRCCEFELHKKEIELAEVANEEGGFVCCTRLIPPFFELREKRSAVLQKREEHPHHLR
jgi:hypothetical protein